MKYGNFSKNDVDRIAGRTIAIESVWIKLKTNVIPRELRDCVTLDRLRLSRVIGSYWNDLLRLKARHNIKERLHRAKVAAYTIKWILHFSPVVCTADRERVASLSEESKRLLLELNQLLAVQCLFYFADALNPMDFSSGGRFERILRDLAYYINTAGYQEKMASVLFEALIIASPTGVKDAKG